jgi:spermidine/putrescine transport system ATP-binding protein
MKERTAGNTDGVVLELTGVTKQFGRVTAVDRLSEQFAGGEYFCILGPSGCGKTTLLRLIAGFETPDTGAIRLHGADVARTPPERRDVNVVFQQYALFPHLSVTDNIGFGLRMKKLARAELQQRVRDALRLVHLEQEAERLPQQLSGGQQQRVALARALVNRPAVLLLDEPLSALDRALRLRMQEELRRVQRETGVTFLHITHDQTEALSLADRIAVMRQGRFLQVGSPRDVYLRPASRFVASFVGTANLLDADVDASGCAAVAGNGFVLRLPAGRFRAGRVVLAIRPEAVQLVPVAATATEAARGIVRHIAFTGAEVDVAVALADGTLLRACLAPAAAAAIAEGDTVGILVDADGVVLLPPDDGG